MPTNTGNFFDILRGSGERRAADLERRVRLNNPTGAGGQHPAHDPDGAHISIRHALDQGLQVTAGRIVDGVAYTHLYKVQLDNGGIVLPCCTLAQTPLHVTGARQLNTLIPGTAVYVLLLNQQTFGVILGARPDFGINAASALSDMVAQGSNCGLHADAIHKFPFQMPGGGGLTDWSAGRPFDGLQIGEWGAITETGLAFFLDSFMAYMRVNEETGVFAFYMDSLLRLSGHNLQMRSAGHDREDLDDEGEFSSVQYYTPYLWEAKGCYVRGTDPFREEDPDQVQQEKAYYSRIEPVEDDQLGLYRKAVFEGYLGQGGLRHVCLPPENAAGVRTYSARDIPLGVAEEFWGLDGSVGLRSAKSIFLMKRPIIPSPRRMTRPEDGAGDTSPSYTANGVGGAHKVADWEGGARRQLVSAAAIMDLMAHAFNWKGQHPFVYHQRDWYLADDADLDPSSALAAALPDYSTLTTNQYLDTPLPVRRLVDDRYGMVNYYPGNSIIGLLDDGGIVISASSGEEIILTAGSIFLRAPADVWVQPGKNLNVWSGWDVILKANNSLDASANWGDVRIKAEHDVMILGGNDRCGGILLQSLAEGTNYTPGAPGIEETVTGIVLRSKLAPVALLSDNYISLLSVTDGSNLEIQLNAGAAGVITTRSQYFYRRVDQAIFDQFPTTANEWWPTHAQLNTGLAVHGEVAVDGPVYGTGNLGVGGSIGNMAAGDVTALHTLLADRDTALQTALATETARIDRLLNDTGIRDVEFFFRGPTEYLTEGLILYEGRWQQQCRLTGKGGDLWNDNYVVNETGVISQAHPGREVWLADSFATQPLRYYDPTTDLSTAKSGGLYEEPTFVALGMAPLSSYLIIINPAE